MEKITKSSDKVLIDPNEPLILPDGTALVGRVEWFLYALCCLDYQNLPTPMSRIEEFANALITGEIPNIQPQSRAEQFFLAILDGNISDLPQPQSRSEVLLDKLARGEFDLSDVEPIQSRYELLLAYLIKNGGIGNIDYVLYEFSEAMKTMYNTVEKPFKSLELSGNTLVNCVLEDTENDDYTSFDKDYSGTSFTINGTSEGAIKSAILKGNTLVNLSKEKTITITTTTSDYVWNNRQVKLDSNLFKAGKKYLYSSKYSYTNDVFNDENPIYFVMVKKDETSERVFLETKEKGIFTIPTDFETTDTLYMRVHAAVGTAIDNTVTCDDIKILEYQNGMENWDIPYFEGMQSVKMPVLTTTGKNLFDGKFPVNSGPYVVYPVEDGTYTFSITDNDASINVDEFSLGDINKNGAMGSIRWIFDEGKYFKTNQTFTNRNLVIYPNTEEAFNKIKQRYHIQIEKGETATTYEPYKTNILTVNEDVELRGIGNVKDELSVATGELTQRIGEIVLDGSENWVKYGNYTQEGYTAFITTVPTLNNYYDSITPFISADFPTGTWRDYRYNLIPELVWNHDPNKIGIRVKNEKASNAEEIKSFLSTNNIRIVYKLAKESIKTVDLNVVDQNNTKIDKIHVFNEITHVNASSDELTPTVNIGKSVSYPTIIKPNTKYTVDLKRNDKPLTVNLDGTEVTFVDGETRKVITTPSTLTNDKLSYYGIGAKCNEIMLIEGEIERNIDYFTGMQSVVMQNQMPILHTVGKNLFDGVSYIDGFIANSNNYTVSPDTDVTSIIFNVNKNTDYILSAKTNFDRSIIGGSVQPITIGTKTTKIEGYRVSNTLKFNSGEFTNIIIYLNSSKIDIEDIQVEEGSVSTTYEPYKSSNLSLSEEIVVRSLPNGVCDTLNVIVGEYVQRIGEITFNGSETWYESGHVAPNHYCAFARVQGSKNALSYNVVCNSLPVRNILSTTIDYEGCMFNEWTSGDKANVVVKIANRKLSSTSVEGIKAYLQSNPITVQYELAEPIITTIDLNVVDQDGNTIPKIKSYKDVTHLEVTVPKQSLLPNVSAEVATDNSKDMSSLTIKHQEISEAQSTIEDNIQSQSDEIDTALMATTEIFESILE